MFSSSINKTSDEIEKGIFFRMPEQIQLIEQILTILQWILYIVLCQVIDVFGVCANVINIIVFCKQGFKDTVNISLLGLAVSDIASLLPLLWLNICYSPAFRALDLPFDSIEVNYLTGGIPHTVFTRSTCWITALITLERCLCIAAPLKVKTILTAKRVTLIIVFLFIICVAISSPVYVVNRLDLKFFPERNKTLIGLVYLANRDEIESVMFVLNNVTLPFVSFIINVVCTVTLVYKLRKTTKWRMKTISSSGGEKVSNQNQKVTKMVVMISSLFIICFTPVSLIFIGFLVEPELFIGGKYNYILNTMVGFGILLESINSSINIFIYFKMSSTYRSVFTSLFHLKIMRK